MLDNAAQYKAILTTLSPALSWTGRRVLVGCDAPRIKMEDNGQMAIKGKTVQLVVSPERYKISALFAGSAQAMLA